MGTYSITEDLSCTPCKHTQDGYCLRNEGDYCQYGECKCPHLIAETKVLESVTTCETTQLVCTACKEPLEPPKTEC